MHCKQNGIEVAQTAVKVVERMPFEKHEENYPLKVNVNPDDVYLSKIQVN